MPERATSFIDRPGRNVKEVCCAISRIASAANRIWPGLSTETSKSGVNAIGNAGKPPRFFVLGMTVIVELGSTTNVIRSGVAHSPSETLRISSASPTLESVFGASSDGSR
ncbi:hypothetical protein MycrhN_1271 [Mycolicibacterium rhodesiae NBB3]|uniref:Uncharacterized protein n=1 Tax=Mycolicibacterium rhodesiae (strain NBB3) TaxID=710685 RepID=G8RX37_MYCRN|nr:hypothetical protein MycrhN_1271 [Mycolicibacterium rhodesiae NBB3]